MSRSPDRPRCRCRVVASSLTVLALVVLTATPVRAEPFFFALLIENGVLFSASADSNGLAAFRSTDRPLRLIENGQAGDVVGTADVFVWTRTVPDPVFTSFGSLAALGVLRLFGLVVHLGLIETPAGTLTTINGFTGGSTALGWHGTWVIAPGSLVGGGANDVIVAGTVDPGPSPTTLSTVVQLNGIYPNPAFSYDPTPAQTHGLYYFEAGSFYGQVTVGNVLAPARAFTSKDVFPNSTRFGHLLAIDTGSKGFLLVACTEVSNVAASPPPVPQQCSLAGTGPALGTVSGAVNYVTTGPAWPFILDFLWHGLP